jgi:signal transduction histidine kinase
MEESERTRASSRWFGLPPRVAAGFGVALLALLAAGGALGYAFAERSARGGAMSRSWATLHALHLLEASVVVSTTTLDVYLVTGDPAQRLRYARAGSAANAALEKVEGAIGTSAPLANAEQSGQAARVVRLGRLVRTIQAQEARLAALRDRGDARAGDRRQTSAIPAALRELHGLVEEMAQAEDAASRELEAAHRRTVTLTYVVAVGAALFLLVLILGAARVVRQDVGRSDREEAEHARALELQQRLMAIVGHDLRTPLSGIVWNAALLGRSGLAESDVRLVRRISMSARRMERLIRDVLDYGRAHAGAGIPIEPEPSDLAAICREVVDEIHDPAHPVSLAAEGDTIGVWDADRVEQIVANLASNAVKYGPPGRPVWVRLFGDRDAVRIEVHDDGGGIPPALRGRLFDAFRRGEGIAGKGSVGLGLFIVRTLVEAHGGSVSVDSAPERGTTFVVRLPRSVRPVAGTVTASAR